MLYLEAPFKYFRTLGKETELLVKSSSYKKKKKHAYGEQTYIWIPRECLGKVVAKPLI